MSFFFQAEDGIRDRTVTGVQTCALPICRSEGRCPHSIIFPACTCLPAFQGQGSCLEKDSILEVVLLEELTAPSECSFRIFSPPLRPLRIGLRGRTCRASGLQFSSLPPRKDRTLWPLRTGLVLALLELV